MSVQSFFGELGSNIRYRPTLIANKKDYRGENDNFVFFLSKFSKNCILSSLVQFPFVFGCSKAKVKQRKTKENTVFRGFRQEKIKTIIFAAVVFFICY